MLLTQRTQSLKSFTEKDYNALSQRIIYCCMEVHKELGPGLMESVYEVCTENVMRKEGLFVQCQVVLPVTFKGEKLEKEFVIDTIVNELIILEFKSVEVILPVHEAQLVTYLKLADKKLGLLINFNVPLLKEGIRRKINGDLNSV
ncbi:MAG: GxxExxY protein [Bacteroidetes bacterium]|nr:GxxExxY protein [Bacteroidota bacterium]